MTFVLYVLINMSKRVLYDNNAGNNKSRDVCKNGIVIDAHRPTSGAFYVSLFSIRLVSVLSEVEHFLFVISCGSGHPEKCRMCAPCLEYTIMHNDEHKPFTFNPFSAPAKLFCIIFLCLILSQKKTRIRVKARATNINIEANSTI